MMWNYVELSRNVCRLCCGGSLVFMGNKSLADSIEDEINEVRTYFLSEIFEGNISNQSIRPALLVIHTQACTSQILHVFASFQRL
jgi:hypothetical protein